MSFPKVIIIGETFRSNWRGHNNDESFKDWPSRQVAVVTELTAESSQRFTAGNTTRLAIRRRRLYSRCHGLKKILSGV